MAGLSLIVNAGGASRRMGQPKALLRVPNTGEPLLRHVIMRLAALPLEQVIVVVNDPNLVAAGGLTGRVQVVTDAETGRGPLAGLIAGLAICAEWALVVACDLPLINPALCRFLYSLAEGAGPGPAQVYEAIVPVVGGREQPLHALYHRAVLPVAEQQLATGERRVAALLHQVRTRWVAEEELRPFDPHLYSFFNVNTPAEWAAACALLA